MLERGLGFHDLYLARMKYKQYRESQSQITSPHNLAAPCSLGLSFTAGDF